MQWNMIHPRERRNLKSKINEHEGSINNKINEAFQNGAGALLPEELPGTSCTSNLWMVKQDKITFALGLQQP